MKNRRGTPKAVAARNPSREVRDAKDAVDRFETFLANANVKKITIGDLNEGEEAYRALRDSRGDARIMREQTKALVAWLESHEQ